MKTYLFHIETRGHGDSPEEAWADAIDTIRSQLDEYLDPDDVPDYVIDEDEEDYDEYMDYLIRMVQYPKFLLKPLGTDHGMVLAQLLTLGGHRVELCEQWLPAAGNKFVWGAYHCSETGRWWWFDHSKVLELIKTAKGKRKPFEVEIKVIGPPPPDAILAVAHGNISSPHRIAKEKEKEQ
jgi:hypothetical protein